MIRVPLCNLLLFICLSHLQAILNSDDTSHVLQELDPDTEYTVTVTAIYPDESESEDLMGDERTCKPRRIHPSRSTVADEARSDFMLLSPSSVKGSRG